MKERVEGELAEMVNCSREGVKRLQSMLANDRVEAQNHRLKARRLVKEA